MMFGDPLFNTPRTWKWAVPAGIGILLVWSATQLPQDWLCLSSLLFAFGGLSFLIAGTNYWKLTSEHKADLYEKRQHALSTTPLVLLSQNMRQMHPEAVKVLNRFGVRTSWQVRVNANQGTRDWVLADTNVHFGFIEFVLSRSGVALYPKNRFSEGSKKWDPDGIVEDREQYDELEKWMFARMMVTRSHGDFRPAEFIPPWTPKLILETMGLTGEQDLYVPEEQPRQDLGKQSSAGSQRSAEVKRQDDFPPLSEAELEAIRVEMARNASQYSS